MTTIVQTRKKYEAWKYPHIERYVNDNFYAFSRGDLLIATTNTYSRKDIQVSYLPESYKEGTIVWNIFYPKDDCLSIKNGALSVTLINGEVKIFIPQNRLVDE